MTFMNKNLFIAMFATLGLAAIPTHDGYVTDRANMLTPQTKHLLEEQLRSYEQRSTNEVAVLVIPSLDGEDVATVANRIFHAWGIGKKGADNGVLFLWSTAEHQLRIEVGYGLESSLPDGRAGQIIRDVIVPSFKEQHWDIGVINGVTAIITQLDAQHASPATPTPVHSDNTAYIVFFVLLGMGVIAIGCWVLLNGRQTKDDTPPERDFPPLPLVMPLIVASTRESEREPDPTPSYSSEPSSSSSSWGSDSSVGDAGSSFGGFGGGDSGGGGASGSY